MTRKDYNAIARALADTKPVTFMESDAYLAAVATWVRDVRAVAKALSDLSGFTPNGNRRFDRDRFLAACGVQ